MASENPNSPGFKGGDAFQTQAITLVDRIANNPKPLIAVLTLIIGLVGAVFGFQYFANSKSEARKVELTKVDQVRERELKTFSEQREVLEKKRDILIAKAPTPAPAAGQTTPPQETPEVKALSKQIEALKPSFPESTEKYLAFYNSQPRTPEGWVAGLHYAAQAIDDKKLEDAQKVLEAIAKESAKNPVIQVESILLLITVLEDRDDLAKALEYAEKLLSVASDELKPRAALTKAQILFLKKDYPNARTQLEKVIADHATTPEADRARGLLALIPA